MIYVSVVNQKYEVQIYDEYVIEGNTAVFRCQVPIYASEFIIVTSWVEGGLHNLYPNTDTGGKYMVMPNGDLYIFHVTEEDSYTSYGCRTVHKLTGEVQVSIYPGRIIMTAEPKGGIQPTLQVEKRSRYKVKLGDNIVLACLAQGYPLPVFRWFREESQKLSPISSNDRFIAEESGILHIHKARFEDKGKYICRINNTIGEEEIQVTLSVT
ncbi:cell adhesion molecule Dscam1-like, partial [Halyomorpha halys]|uniref:cell adhesion molecule Dscam1-like n=1 Tax=Halyomorpha halys TaxID=286706 RepID=UPI0034D15C26